MARRIHVPQLWIGDIPLDPAQAHHARHVLRLAHESAVEVFDDAGASAAAALLHLGPRDAAVRVTRIDSPAKLPSLEWIVASAVPKGDRADWLVEKLSELGATAFIPLATARSVVLPEGKGKHDRWVRIATEAAKQSRRSGVMRIEKLTALTEGIQRLHVSQTGVSDKNGTGPVIPPARCGWFLATEVPAMPMADAVAAVRNTNELTIFVGPEGGWTDPEIAELRLAGITAVRLGATILRVETAAIAVGAVVASLLVA